MSLSRTLQVSRLLSRSINKTTFVSSSTTLVTPITRSRAIATLSCSPSICSNCDHACTAKNFKITPSQSQSQTGSSSYSHSNFETKGCPIPSNLRRTAFVIVIASMLYLASVPFEEVFDHPPRSPMMYHSSISHPGQTMNAFRSEWKIDVKGWKRRSEE